MIILKKEVVTARFTVEPVEASLSLLPGITHHPKYKIYNWEWDKTFVKEYDNRNQALEGVK